MINPRQLVPSYQDWWPEFNPNTISLLAGINHSRCYVPKLFVTPSGGNLVQNKLAPQSYTNFVLEIPPGSFIYGFYHGTTQNFTMQVTDLGLSYRWFNTPIPDQVFLNNPDGCYLLPAPYPVMNPGTLFFEFWSTVQAGGDSTNLAIVVGAAVPVEALYRG